MASAPSAASGSLYADTRFGLQGNLKINETFSAVGQLLADRYQAKNTVHVEWLYLQAAPVSWLSLRAGRMVLPVFLISDSRNVGYATYWLRAPDEVYGIFPLSYFDGAQATATTNWLGTNFTAQLSAGKAKGKFYTSQTFELQQNMDNIRSVNLIAEHGNWTLRYGHSASNQTVAGFGGPDPEVFSGLGLEYDNGQLIARAEHITRRQHMHAADSDGDYISAGWRFGPWTPYATYSKSRFIGFFYRGSGQTKGSDTALGVRWDVAKNVALKAQFDRSDNAPSFVAVPQGVTVPKTSVVSLGLDFVF